MIVARILSIAMFFIGWAMAIAGGSWSREALLGSIIAIAGASMWPDSNPWERKP